MKAFVFKNLKVFRKFKFSDLKPGMLVQLHNGKEAIHIKIVGKSTNGIGKFYGTMETFLLFPGALKVTKGDLIMASFYHVDRIIG